MRITLSGDLGSGKSSVGRRLAETLGVPHYSAGSLFRDIGQISNLDALKTNLAAENNVAIDNAVDDRTRKLDRTVQSFVIDARMAWHFVTNATKVYLAVSPRTAAERIMADDARGSETYDDIDSAIAGLAERRTSEAKRYKRLYDVDITDVAKYDLFIITDDTRVEDIADLIVAHAKGNVSGKYWIGKTRIVPLIEPPAAIAPTDGGTDPLPLTIADNFGFYAGDARTLAVSMAAPLPLIGYVPAPTPAGFDVVDDAKRSVTPTALRAWTNVTGIGFAFAKLLGSATAG